MEYRWPSAAASPSWFKCLQRLEGVWGLILPQEPEFGRDQGNLQLPNFEKERAKDRAILGFFPTTQGCREDGLVDPDGKHRSLGIVDGGGFTRGRGFRSGRPRRCARLPNLLGPVSRIFLPMNSSKANGPAE
ncbi:hypothetical protein U1Q18_027630 [Sarracenia purpurea var. burkii]